MPLFYLQQQVIVDVAQSITFTIRIRSLPQNKKCVATKSRTEKRKPRFATTQNFNTIRNAKIEPALLSK